MRKHDDRLPARHILITGGTGSGKTTWVKRCAEIQQYRIHLLWDPDKSHTAVHISSRVAFLNAVRAGIKSGKRMRLALSVNATEDAFQFFCRVVWAASCSTRPMVVIVEELAEVTNSGKARNQKGYDSGWLTILNRGRKYALQIVAISQRPQEIDKTTLTQCATKVTGSLDRHNDRKLMANELSCSVDAINELRRLNTANSLNYLVLRPGRDAIRQRINPKQSGNFHL